MSQKKLAVMILALAVALVAIPLFVIAQAPQGQPPAQGQREGRGDRGGAGGQRAAAPLPPPMQIKQVKPGLYMVINNGGNSTVRVTDQGIVLVDTKNLGDQFYNELLAQIKTVSPQPVKEVVVTHVHQDHSGNIGKFVQAGVPVITNTGLKQNLETGGVDGKGYTSAAGKPAPPSVTYDKNRKFKLGKAKVEVYHFGRAHTGGDSVVYFPDLKVIAMGDEFVTLPNGPNADYPNGGSVVEYAKTLGQALKLDFDTVIPGHGNDPATKADLAAFQKKMQMIADKAVALAKKGTPKDQIRQQIQGPELGTWQMTGLVNDQRLDAFYNEVTNAAKTAKK